MYALLSRPWWIAGLSLFAGLVLISQLIIDILNLSVPLSTTARLLSAAIVIVISYLFGSSGYGSFWRRLWRRFPSLNDRVFPDINGIWVGSTHSNWPIIDTMRKYASKETMMPEDQLAETSLQEDAIVVEIKASLLSVKVFAVLSRTKGKSHSLTSKPRWDPNSEKMHLSYTYSQDTPNPFSTDESQHIGAADLAFYPGNPDKFCGVYWTRRKWRQGLNTAGFLSLKKISNRIAPERSLAQIVEDENLFGGQNQGQAFNSSRLTLDETGRGNLLDAAEKRVMKVSRLGRL